MVRTPTGAQVDHNMKVEVTHEDDNVTVGTPMLEAVAEDARIRSKKEVDEADRDCRNRRNYPTMVYPSRRQRN